MCVIQETDQLKYEDVQDDLIGVYFGDLPLNIDHISKDELCITFKPFNLFLDKNGKVGSDQDGGFGYVVIEGFLKPIKEEDVEVELIDTIHPKIEEPFNHMYGDELIEDSICFDWINDQVECLEFVIIEDPLEDVDD